MPFPTVRPGEPYLVKLYADWTCALLLDVLLDAGGPQSTTELAEITGEPVSQVTGWLEFLGDTGLAIRVPGCRGGASWVLNETSVVVRQLREDHRTAGPGGGGPPLSRVFRSWDDTRFDPFSSGPAVASEDFRGP